MFSSSNAGQYSPCFRDPSACSRASSANLTSNPSPQVWAVLTARQSLALFFWEKCQHPLKMSLTAALLYRRMGMSQAVRPPPENARQRCHVCSNFRTRGFESFFFFLERLGSSALLFLACFDALQCVTSSQTIVGKFRPLGRMRQR